MKCIIIITLMLVLLCSCTQNDLVTGNPLQLVTADQVSQAKEIARETEDAVLEAEKSHDPPPQSLIDLAKETLPIPKAALDLNLEEKPEVFGFDDSAPEKTIVGAIYIDKLFGTKEEYVKYKNYKIVFMQSAVYEKMPEPSTFKNDERLATAHYQFGDHTLYTFWIFETESQKLYVCSINIIDSNNMVGTIMLVNDEKEMSQKLAKQIYEDFRGISLADLKKLN